MNGRAKQDIKRDTPHAQGCQRVLKSMRLVGFYDPYINFFLFLTLPSPSQPSLPPVRHQLALSTFTSTIIFGHIAVLFTRQQHSQRCRKLYLNV